MSRRSPVVGHHVRVRHLVVLTASVLGLGALSAAPASAADSTLGTTGPPVVCNTAVPAAVLLGGGATALYTATTPGVVTRFSTVANAVDGQVRAIVLGPGATPTQRTVAAKSPRFQVTRSVLNTFQVRLPVAAGQQLALGYTTPGMGCATAGSTGDVTWIATGFDPDTSATFTPNGTLSPGTPRPNISAVLEPDVDRDGYGDTTQDACPQSALTQAACPAPDTDITKRPKRFRANPKVKVKFSATIPGSTFECQLDGRRWKPCASPYKAKLGIGTHKLKVRATSPVGITDPKPAKVKVTITRGR